MMSQPHPPNAAVRDGGEDPRAVPHDADAEAAVLAAVLIDASALAVVRKVLGAESFYVPAHRRVYAAMLALDAAGSAIDPITLTRHLKQRGELEGAGGHGCISALMDAAPTPANVAHHAAIVREAAARREVIAAAEAAANDARAGREPASVISRELQAALLPLAADGGDVEGFQRIEVGKVLADIDARGQPGAAGVCCGYPEIDAQTHGFRPGELVIIGAVPKGGKTALALEIARRNAFAGRGVGIVSAEMSHAQVAERLLNAESGVPVASTASGRVSESEARALADASRRIAAAPLWIYDAATPTLDDVAARVTALKAENPEVQLVIVDFLQLIQHRLKGRRGDEELGAVSYGLKALAKRTACVVLAPCQLNYKDVEDRPGQRPRLRDLAGGSGMLQAADFVALAHRPAMYSPTAPDVIELDFTSRRTPPFRVTLAWDGCHMRIRSQQR